MKRADVTTLEAIGMIITLVGVLMFGAWFAVEVSAGVTTPNTGGYIGFFVIAGGIALWFANRKEARDERMKDKEDQRQRKEFLLQRTDGQDPHGIAQALAELVIEKAARELPGIWLWEIKKWLGNMVFFPVFLGVVFGLFFAFIVVLIVLVVFDMLSGVTATLEAWFT